MYGKKWVLRFGIVATLAAIGWSCEGTTVIVEIGGDVDTLVVVAIDLESGTAVLSELRLLVGDTAVLDATAFNILNEALEGAAISWSSSTPGVATVSDGGIVAALAPGATTISASSGSVTANVPTTVSDTPGGPPPVQAQGSIEISPATTTISTLGGRSQLSASALDSLSNPISPPLTWRSTDATVASVNSSGLVTAVNFGTASITVASGCCAPDTALVTVRSATASTDLDWFTDWTQGGLGLAGITGGGYVAGTPAQGFNGTNTQTDTFMTVVDSSEIGFPASRLLRVDLDSLQGVNTGMVRLSTKLDTIPIGGALFVRVYEMQEREIGDCGNYHTFHMGTNETAYGFRWYWDNGCVAANGSYTSQTATWGSTTGRGSGPFYPGVNGHRAGSGALYVDSIYRRELRFHRSHADSLYMDARIYNAAGSLILDSSDFLCSAPAGPRCQSGDVMGTYAYYVPDWDGYRGVEIGNNGNAPPDPGPDRHQYWGSVAIRITTDTTAWIGAYPAGPEGR